MKKYIKELEKQNEQLQKKLSKCEQIIADSKPQWKRFKRSPGVEEYDFIAGGVMQGCMTRTNATSWDFYAYNKAVLPARYPEYAEMCSIVDAPTVEVAREIVEQMYKNYLARNKKEWSRRNYV
jgi:hypothetical protein